MNVRAQGHTRTGTAGRRGRGAGRWGVCLTLPSTPSISQHLADDTRGPPCISVKHLRLMLSPRHRQWRGDRRGVCNCQVRGSGGGRRFLRLYIPVIVCTLYTVRRPGAGTSRVSGSNILFSTREQISQLSAIFCEKTALATRTQV